MAIQWGPWEYSGGNGMRVGIDVSRTSVSHSSSSCTVTFKIYTQNQYRYNNPNMRLNISGTGSWSDVTFNNTSTGGSVKRSTKKFTYNFDNNDYGEGTARHVSITASISNAYNGVTPSKSVSIAIPKRPIAEPVPPTNVKLTRDSDATTNISWSRTSSHARPVDRQQINRWDNVGNTWAPLVKNIAPGHTSINVATVPNRRYRYAVYTQNSKGFGRTFSDYIQTSPAAPSGCSVSKTGVDSVVVRWSNGASTNNYSYTTLLEEQVDGGAWKQVATISGGTSSYSRTGRNPGSVYRYRVRARSTVGATTYSGYSTSGTIQLQAPPAAPTGVSVVRSNDYSFTLNWVNNPDGATAPYDSLTVQRWNNVAGAWETIGTLAGTATSLTDTSTTVDREYRWRVAASNSAGTSAWATSETFQTRPAPPSGVRAKAAPGGAIKVTWVNEVSYESYSTRLRYFKNGTLVASDITLAAGETEYLLGDVDLTATYVIGVQTVSTVGYASESDWVDSASVAAATVPDAPENLSPRGTAIDVSIDQPFAWTHNPTLDESEQTAFEVQLTGNGGETWLPLPKVTSTESAWTLPGGVLANGVEDAGWRVRTWGVHADPSPWSEMAPFVTSKTPTVTINEPSGTTLLTSKIEVQWSYSDHESTPQAKWEVELYNELGQLLEARTEQDSATSVVLNTVAIDGKSYTLRVRATDGHGLVSQWAEKSLTASFTPPAVPEISADYSQESGVTVLTLTPQSTTEPGTEVARNLAPAAQPSETSVQPRDGGNAGYSPDYYAGDSDWFFMDDGEGPEVDGRTIPYMRKQLKALADRSRLTWMLTPWDIDTLASSDEASFHVTEGRTYRVSYFARVIPTNEDPAELILRTSYKFHDATLASLPGGTTSDTVVAYGEWQRVTFTFEAPAGAVGVGIRQDWAGTQSEFDADTCSDITGLIITDVTDDPERDEQFFTGSTERGEGVYFEWEGEVNSSESTKRLIGSLEPTGVDLQRRLLDHATGEFGEWETLVENVTADATLIDTTAPIANDGEYRVLAHSAAPSAKFSPAKPPSGFDDRWVYLSGGPNFSRVCRLMGNVSLRTTTTRDRALYQFAGRRKPVMFAGEARTRVIDVAGLLDSESSSPAEWEALIADSEVVLFRDPLGHRIYGSVPQVAIDHLGNDMYAISFTVTEVSYP